MTAKPRSVNSRYIEIDTLEASDRKDYSRNSGEPLIKDQCEWSGDGSLLSERRE